MLIDDIRTAATAPQGDREEHLGLGGTGVVAGSLERVFRVLEVLGIAPRGDPHRSGPTKKDVSALRIAVRPQPQCGVVEALGGFDGVQGGGPVTRVPQRIPRGVGERSRVETRRLSELESHQVVIREHLGLLVGPT